MDKVIRNIIIAILIGIVIVLILYAFGDSKHSSPSSSPSTPTQIPGMKLITPNYPISTSREGFDAESSISDSDLQIIRKLVRMVGASKISDTDTTGWVKTLSGQTQNVTNPRTDLRATIGYSGDEFTKNVEIIPGVVGYQFERIQEIPQPVALYLPTTTTTTSPSSTSPSTTTVGTTTTSAAGTITTKQLNTQEITGTTLDKSMFNDKKIYAMKVSIGGKYNYASTDEKNAKKPPYNIFNKYNLYTDTTTNNRLTCYFNFRRGYNFNSNLTQTVKNNVFTISSIIKKTANLIYDTTTDSNLNLSDEWDAQKDFYVESVNEPDTANNYSGTYYLFPVNDKDVLDRTKYVKIKLYSYEPEYKYIKLKNYTGDNYILTHTSPTTTGPTYVSELAVQFTKDIGNVTPNDAIIFLVYNIAKNILDNNSTDSYIILSKNKVWTESIPTYNILSVVIQMQNVNNNWMFGYVLKINSINTLYLKGTSNTIIPFDGDNYFLLKKATDIEIKDNPFIQIGDSLLTNTTTNPKDNLPVNNKFIGMTLVDAPSTFEDIGPLILSDNHQRETFENLPTTQEYQKLLLKLANKSKSGIPNPYYFNPSAGFKFNIIFNNTPGLTNSTSAECDAVITSIADGQQITFDKCDFVYSSTAPNKIQLTFSKESKPDPLLVSTADFGQIANGVLVNQKFDLQLECKPSTESTNIGTDIGAYTGQDRTKFLSLINSQVVIPISTLTYTLHISAPGINAEQDILSYEINMASIMARHENMQEYTYRKMGALTEELLNEKVGNIVTPMFVMDNKLNNMENKLKNVKDAYFFNNLNNGQTNYRFFNTV